MTQSKDAGPGGFSFNSRDLTEALSKHVGVFKAHQLTVVDVTSDIENLEKFFQKNSIGLAFSFDCTKCKEAKSLELNYVDLHWARYGASFRLLFSLRDDEDEFNPKPLTEAMTDLRIKLHRVLPEFTAAFASHVKSRELSSPPAEIGVRGAGAAAEKLLNTVNRGTASFIANMDTKPVTGSATASTVGMSSMYVSRTSAKDTDFVHDQPLFHSAYQAALYARSKK